MSDKNYQFPISNRVRSLPPYIFHTLKEWQSEVEVGGVVTAKLSIGSPDQRPPQFVLDAMCDAVQKPGMDGYGPFDGYGFFKEACATWLAHRFGVKVDPEKHIIALIGSKEGLGNLPRALCNEGDEILIPDPGYAAYQTSIFLAGSKPLPYLLDKSSQFLPDLSAIKRISTNKTKLIYLNYPNNPSGKCITRNQLSEVSQALLDRGLTVIHDNPYCELYRGTQAPPSLLQVTDIQSMPVMEFFSFSKMFNMGGWRLGFVVGHEKLIGALRNIKTHMDTGQSGAMQKAASVALTDHVRREAFLKDLRAIYDERFTVTEAALDRWGFSYIKPEGSFYVWIRTPNGVSDMDFTRHAMRSNHIVVTPGSAFGASGRDYFRITLTHATDKLQQYVERLAKARDSI